MASFIFKRNSTHFCVLFFSLIGFLANVYAQEGEPVAPDFTTAPYLSEYDYCPQTGLPGVKLMINQPGNASEPLPVVVYFPGYLEARKPGTFNYHRLSLEQRGFIAVTVGYPEPHITDKAKLRYVDYAACAIRWLRAHSFYDQNGDWMPPPKDSEGNEVRQRYHIDPKRIGVVGHSTGGMIAAYLAMVDRDNTDESGKTPYQQMKEKVDQDIQEIVTLKQEIAGGLESGGWSADHVIADRFQFSAETTATDSAANALWTSYTDKHGVEQPISNAVQGAVVASGHGDWLTLLTSCGMVNDKVAAHFADLNPGDPLLSRAFLGKSGFCMSDSSAVAQSMYDNTSQRDFFEKEWGGYWGSLIYNNVEQTRAKNFFNDLSPVSYFSETAPVPMMLVHGRSDFLVPPESATMLGRYIKSKSNNEAVIKTVIEFQQSHFFSFGSISLWSDFFEVLFHGTETVPTNSLMFEQSFNSRFGGYTPSQDASSYDYFCKFKSDYSSYHALEKAWAQANSGYRNCDPDGTNEAVDGLGNPLELVDQSNYDFNNDDPAINAVNRLMYLEDYTKDYLLPTVHPTAQQCNPTKATCSWKICNAIDPETQQRVSECSSGYLQWEVIKHDHDQSPYDADSNANLWKTTITYSDFSEEGITLNGTVISYHDDADSGGRFTDQSLGGLFSPVAGQQTYLQIDDGERTYYVEEYLTTLAGVRSAGAYRFCSQANCAGQDSQGWPVERYSRVFSLPGLKERDVTAPVELPLKGYMVKNSQDNFCLSTTEKGDYYDSQLDRDYSQVARKLFYNWNWYTLETGQLLTTRACDPTDSKQRWLIKPDSLGTTVLQPVDQPFSQVVLNQCVRFVDQGNLGQLMTANCDFYKDQVFDGFMRVTETGFAEYSVGPLTVYNQFGRPLATGGTLCAASYSPAANIAAFNSTITNVNNLLDVNASGDVSDQHLKGIVGGGYFNCTSRTNPFANAELPRNLRWSFHLQNDEHTAVDIFNPPYPPLDLNEIIEGRNWKISIGKISGYSTTNSALVLRAKVTDPSNTESTSAVPTWTWTHVNLEGGLVDTQTVVPEGLDFTIPAPLEGIYTITVTYAPPGAVDGTGNPLVITRKIDVEVFATTDSDSDGLNDLWELSYYGNLDQGASDDFAFDSLNGESAPTNLEVHDQEMKDKAVLFDYINYQSTANQRFEYVKGRTIACELNSGLNGDTPVLNCEWFLCQDINIVDQTACEANSLGWIRWKQTLPNVAVDPNRLETAINYKDYEIDGLLLSGTVIQHTDTKGSGRSSTLVEATQVLLDPTDENEIPTVYTAPEVLILSTKTTEGQTPTAQLHLNLTTIEKVVSGGYITLYEYSGGAFETQGRSFSAPNWRGIPTEETSLSENYMPGRGYLIRHKDSELGRCIERSQVDVNSVFYPHSSQGSKKVLMKDCSRGLGSEQRWLLEKVPADTPDTADDNGLRRIKTLDQSAGPVSEECLHYTFVGGSIFATESCAPNTQGQPFNPVLLLTKSGDNNYALGPQSTYDGNGQYIQSANKICAEIADFDQVGTANKNDIFNCISGIASRMKWQFHLQNNLSLPINITRPPYDVVTFPQLITGKESSLTIDPIETEHKVYGSFTSRAFAQEGKEDLILHANAVYSDGSPIATPLAEGTPLARQVRWDWHVSDSENAGTATVLDSGTARGDDLSLPPLQWGYYVVEARVTDSYNRTLTQSITFAVLDPDDLDNDGLLDAWEYSQGLSISVDHSQLAGTIAQQQLQIYRVMENEYRVLETIRTQAPEALTCLPDSSDPNRCQWNVCANGTVSQGANDCDIASGSATWTKTIPNPEKDPERVETIVHYENYPVGDLTLSGTVVNHTDGNGNGRTATVVEQTVIRRDYQLFPSPAATTLTLFNAAQERVKELDFDMTLMEEEPSGGFVTVRDCDATICSSEQSFSVPAWQTIPAEDNLGDYLPRAGYLIKHNASASPQCMERSLDQVYSDWSPFSAQGSQKVYARDCEPGANGADQRWYLQGTGNYRQIQAFGPSAGTANADCLHYTFVGNKSFATESCQAGAIATGFNPNLLFTTTAQSTYVFGPTTFNNVANAVTNSFNNICADVNAGTSQIQAIGEFNCNQRNIANINANLQWRFYLQNNFKRPIDIYQPPYNLLAFDEILSGKTSALVVNEGATASTSFMPVGQAITLTAQATYSDGQLVDEPIEWAWQGVLANGSTLNGSGSGNSLTIPMDKVAIGSYTVVATSHDSYNRLLRDDSISFDVRDPQDIDGDQLNDDWEVKFGLAADVNNAIALTEAGEEVPELLMYRAMEAQYRVMARIVEAVPTAQSCDPMPENSGEDPDPDKCAWHICQNGPSESVSTMDCLASAGSVTWRRTIPNLKDSQRYETIIDFQDYVVGNKLINGRVVKHTDARGNGRSSTVVEQTVVLRDNMEILSPAASTIEIRTATIERELIGQIDFNTTMMVPANAVNTVNEEVVSGGWLSVRSDCSAEVCQTEERFAMPDRSTINPLADLNEYMPSNGYIIKHAFETRCIERQNQYKLVNKYLPSHNENYHQDSFTAFSLDCKTGTADAHQRWILDKQPNGHRRIKSYDQDLEQVIDDCLYFSHVGNNTFGTESCTPNASGMTFNPDMVITHHGEQRYLFGPLIWFDAWGNPKGTNNNICAQRGAYSALAATGGYNCNYRNNPANKFKWQFFLQNNFNWPIDINQPPYAPETFNERVHGKSGTLTVEILSPFDQSETGELTVLVYDSLRISVDAKDVNGTDTLEWSYERDGVEEGSSEGTQINLGRFSVGAHTVTVKTRDSYNRLIEKTLAFNIVYDPELDSDGDGFTDYEEFQAGTDLFSADDFPGLEIKEYYASKSVIKSAGETVQIHWQTQSVTSWQLFAFTANVMTLYGLDDTGVLNYASYNYDINTGEVSWWPFDSGIASNIDFSATGSGTFSPQETTYYSLYVQGAEDATYSVLKVTLDPAVAPGIWPGDANIEEHNFISTAVTVAEDGSRYVSAFDESYYKYDNQQALAWQLAGVGLVKGKAAVTDNLVIIGTNGSGAVNGQVVAMRPNSVIGNSLHTELWHFDTESHVIASPVFNADKTIVYVVTYAGMIHALAASNGDEIWRYKLPLSSDGLTVPLPDEAIVVTAPTYKEGKPLPAGEPGLLIIRTRGDWVYGIRYDESLSDSARLKWVQEKTEKE